LSDPLFLHRLQFAFTIVYHYLFPVLTMGLALLIVVMKALGLRPGGERSMTTYNASSDPAGLRTAVGWLAIGLPLAILYFVFLFRFHRGKAAAPADGEGC
jgi:cytochrome bd ubiquinol oxidase subunit I